MTELPRWLWMPGRKPWPPQLVEFHAQARLAIGLISCVAFDSCCAKASGSIIDYYSESQAFNLNGSASSVTSPFGGGAFSTPGNGTTDYLSYAITIPVSVSNSGFGSGFSSGFGPAIVPPGTTPTTNWTISFLSKFSGSVSTGTQNVFSDSTGSNGITINQGTSSYKPIGGADFTPALTTFTTWTRHTFTSDGTTVSFYSNGVLQSTVSLSVSVSIGRILWNWGYPTSDFFIWSRTLSAQDVATHVQDPFGTTLRIVYPLRPLVMTKEPFIAHPQLQPMMAT